MTQELQPQGSFGINIEPLSLTIRQPGGSNEERLILTVTNPGPFTSIIRWHFFDELKEDYRAALWFKKIGIYNVEKNVSDEKEIHVTAALEPEKALAGVYNIDIRVVDSGNQNRQDSKIVSLHLLRVGDYGVGQGEVIESTEQSASYKLGVTNNANAPLTIWIKEPSQDQPYLFIATSITVAPSQSADITVMVILKEGESLPAGSSIDLSTEGAYQLIGGASEQAPEKRIQVNWPGPEITITVDPSAFSTDPGAAAGLTVAVTNQGQHQQMVDLRMEGFPADWEEATITPAHLSFLPNLPGNRQEAKIEFSVPKDLAQALAGIYSLSVHAKVQNGQEATPIAVAMRVNLSGEPTIKPPKLLTQSEQKADFQVSIENVTNTTLKVHSKETQPEARLNFTLAPDPVMISPSAPGNAILTVMLKSPEQRPEHFAFVMKRGFLDKDNNELKPADDWTIPIDWPAPQLTITQPPEQARVPRAVIISGSFQNLPPGMHMWLYVYAPVAEKYYLDKIVLADQTRGIWEVQNVTIGSEDDFGASFRIGVILANATANAELEAQSERTELPDGVQTFHEITVIRESRVDDTEPEMDLFIEPNFSGSYKCKGFKYQESVLGLRDKERRWITSKSFIIKTGFWCIWPRESWEDFELLGPGRYSNKSVRWFRAIPTQGITLFEHSYFRGKMLNLTSSNPDLGQSDGFHNQISSVIVSTGDWRLYEDPNYVGDRWIVYEGKPYPDFSKTLNLNDVVSSVERLS